jgi:hypothetical protein
MTTHAKITLGSLLFLCVIGCADEVAAPSGVEEPFSVYGIMNPLLPTQTLLVSATENSVAPASDSIDAVVTSTNLTTGERHVWQDSVSANETDQLDHVFWAEFRPDFSTRHLIEVIRSDGAASLVYVDVPMDVTVESEDTGTRDLIAYIRGGDFRIMRADVVYSVRRHPDTELSENPQLSYSFSYISDVSQTASGFQIDIDLHRHFDVIASLYMLDIGGTWSSRRFPFHEGLALMRMNLRLTVGNDAWNPPGRETGQDVLVHPGTLSNVENGFGFVGGGYNRDYPLYPSASAIADTWFFDFLCRPYANCTDP